jgi:ADP-ribose pyrophosphatase YjhB (NUDIX family)
MNFCSNCGAPVSLIIPDGDNRERFVCARCKTIHYQNPKLVIGTVPVWEDRVLLCKRAIEPRMGFWTLPAGFMENGETTAEAAARETLEEANARVHLMEPYTMYSVTYVDQVHLYYRAALLDTRFGPGTESLEVRLFSEEEVPWAQLAFRTVAVTLKHFFADRAEGKFQFHTGSLLPIR